MLDFIKKIFAPEEAFDSTRVSIRQMKNGRYRLLENGNEVVATYGRYSDALRGAQRRGLEIR